MKKMHEMQVFLNQTDDAELIRSKSLELFKVSDLESTIFEEDMLALGEYMEEYLEPLRPLFTHMFWHATDNEFWKEIENYIEFKDRANFNPPL